MIQMTKEKIERLTKNARYLGPCNVIMRSGARCFGDVVITSSYCIVTDFVNGTKTVIDKNLVRIVELSQTEDQFS
jgi:hypothetical protein